MRSLVIFNINTGLISICSIEDGKTKNIYFEWLEAMNMNGNVIIRIDGDWRDFTNKQLVAKCDEIIMNICKSRLGDDYN